MHPSGRMEEAALVTPEGWVRRLRPYLLARLARAVEMPGRLRGPRWGEGAGTLPMQSWRDVWALGRPGITGTRIYQSGIATGTGRGVGCDSYSVGPLPALSCRGRLFTSEVVLCSTLSEFIGNPLRGPVAHSTCVPSFIPEPVSHEYRVSRASRPAKV